MAEVEPEHAIEAAAMQYHRSGYTILRNAVPVQLLRDLQRRFDEHAAAYVQSLGADVPRGRLTFYELNEDAAFTELAELLTRHPVLARCAELSWNRAAEIDHKPYGSVLLGGEPSDGSWHVDAQGPMTSKRWSFERKSVVRTTDRSRRVAGSNGAPTCSWSRERS